MIKYYAGIGSRNAPMVVLRLIDDVANALAIKGYTLRSGGAVGCDKAFEAGAKRHGDAKIEIFKSKDVDEGLDYWVFEEAETCLPTDRSGFVNWGPYVRGLIARNMMQVLGRYGKTPVEFVLC